MQERGSDSLRPAGLARAVVALAPDVPTQRDHVATAGGSTPWSGRGALPAGMDVLKSGLLGNLRAIHQYGACESFAVWTESHVLSMNHR